MTFNTSVINIMIMFLVTLHRVRPLIFGPSKTFSRPLRAAATSLRPGPASMNSLCHSLLQSVVQVGNVCIDATCGNGHDAFFLANRALNETQGRLICYDIQQRSIQATQIRLSTIPTQAQARIEYRCSNHRNLGHDLPEGTVNAIVYNLGYLPGSIDKAVSTVKSDTIESLKHAIVLLAKGGALSITCYRGHPGGKEECDAVDAFCRTLDYEMFVVQRHETLNRGETPILYTVYRNELCKKPQISRNSLINDCALTNRVV